MSLIRLCTVLIVSQCFVYRNTDFGFSVDLGLTVTPDRLIFLVFLVVAIAKFGSRDLDFAGLGPIGRWTLIFGIICTVSAFIAPAGWGQNALYYLFDFIFGPLLVFLVMASIPHDAKKLNAVTLPFLLVGAYFVVNGTFEHFGVQALVWPQYIFDHTIGIHRGRTRGSFASADALGMALTVTFHFYAFYISRVKGRPPYWAYLVILLTPGVIYTTNLRAAWLGFGLSLLVLAIVRSKMKRIGIAFVALVLVGFASGLGTHFSVWEERTLFSKRQETVEYRVINNRVTFAMGAANPLFGVGFGGFRSAWPEYFAPFANLGPRDLNDGNHNTFLGLFAEVGLVGLIPYFMILYHMARVGFLAYRRQQIFDREFSLLCLLVLVTYIVGANFADYRSGSFRTTVLYFLFGSLARIEVETGASALPRTHAHSDGCRESGRGSYHAGVVAAGL